MKATCIIPGPTRYPDNGMAAATGENVIELAEGSGVKVRYAQVITNTAELEVCINGEKMKLHRYLGDWMCEHKHIIQTPNGREGGIQSLTVKGDGQFYANLE